MKIKKNVALSLVGGISLALGLGAMSVFAVDKQIKIDLTNIIQHMQRVVIIDKTSNNSATLKLSQGGMVGVDANNFIISQEGESMNKIEGDSSYSNILGGERNLISGYTSTILGGKSNENRGNTSTILGGEGNRINAGNDSTIIGGSGNVLKGSGSVIAGGDANSVSGNYSVVVGNKSSVTGNNSVALGSGSRVKASNSFLWTDGKNRAELTTDNVFAVFSDHGMVVNTGKAHDFAQLTIGGPLVIHKLDSDIIVCDAAHKGVVKLVTGDNKVCFCSCDGGDYWHSLYGQGTCEGRCNNITDNSEHMPECGSTVKRITVGSSYVFSGSCNEHSKPVVGSGAYFVDMNGKVYWTCQTDAGKTASCSGFATNA